MVAFSFALAAVFARVWPAAKVWPRNFVGNSDNALVSPSARWKVALGKTLPLSINMETHLAGFSLMPRSLHAESVFWRVLW